MVTLDAIDKERIVGLLARIGLTANAKSYILTFTLLLNLFEQSKLHRRGKYHDRNGRNYYTA